MTPLYRHFEALLPAPLVWPALCLAYFAMMVAILLFEQRVESSIIYIDFHS
ncbi:hypothetical protein GCM10009127_22430 [Alteraurantiacibacter aestuarii]|uniref:hypothetical protein n=1 Tax=Alteraurantiacibacter aestuarii TaxID=650004 RepID=UPI0031D27D47